jgi:hypothetical protein
VAESLGSGGLTHVSTLGGCGNASMREGCPFLRFLRCILVTRMHELLEAILAMHSAYGSVFLHLACAVGVSGVVMHLVF